VENYIMRGTLIYGLHEILRRQDNMGVISIIRRADEKSTQIPLKKVN
jgi:hypothetical protein